MAIAPTALRAFKERKRKNSEKAKLFTHDALLAKVARLDPQPQFFFEPYDHQYVCFLLAQMYQKYLFLLDMGLGKTKLVLDVFSYAKEIGRAHRAIVLVEATVHTTLWEEEARIHTPDLTVVGLNEKMTSEQRVAAVNGDADVIVVTYQGWTSMVSESVMDAKTKKGAWHINPTIARDLERNFDFAAFDESTNVANHQSLWYKSAARIAKQVESLYLLTGTGFSSDPVKLWPQFKLVDGGHALGETLGLFRSFFFTEVKRPWIKWPEFQFRKKLEPELHRMMKHCSIRYSDEECLDLPPMIGGIDDPVIRHCLLPKETWKYHNSLVEDREKGKGNVEVMEHTYTRLRMLASGYLPVKDQEGGKHQITFKENPKVEVLNALLAEIPPDDKVIVSFHYIGTGGILRAAMKAKKIKFATIDGATKDPGKEYLKFRDDPKCRVLLGSKAAAKGLNLQFCRRLIFFESPDDIEIRKQWERRIKRKNQTRKMYVYDIVVKGTLDEKIIPRLKDYKRTNDAVMDGKIKLKRFTE
tara:strand:+ start:3736 stop:5316 length:1581 start_codon:yes stop_codon:yes gene_type:complete